MGAYLGMRGSTNFEADGTYKWRPENWREMLLYLEPNGMSPFTAMLSMLKNESTDDPIYHWFEKEMPTQSVAITAIHVASALNDTWASEAATALTTSLYPVMAAADIAQFKVGHTVMIACSADLTKYIRCLVTARTVNGASSYLTCLALETKTAAGETYDICWAIGTAYPEGDTLSSGIVYDPTDYSNYTQIFRNSLEQTRTASKTRLRTGDSVKQAKTECLMLHGIEMEKAFIFNPAKQVTTGTNGKPLRITGGFKSALSTNVVDYTTEAGAATWKNGGLDWLEEHLEILFRYGSQQKIAYCGSGALLGIQQLVRENSQFAITPTTRAFGIKVLEWITPFGTLDIKTHPLFTQQAITRNEMMIVDPKYLTYRYLKDSDTKYLANRQANDLDGEKSEYLTEAGLEVHFEKAHGWFSGVGLANT